MLTGSIGAMVWYNLKEAKAEETFATQPVKRGTVVDKLGETGTIELVRTVEVKSTIAGEIRELPIEAGDWVEAGDLMALIEPDPNQSLQLYQKRSAVKQARISRRARTGEEIMLLFDEVHTEGNTVLLVTHEADIAARARRLIRIHDGRIDSNEVKDR